MKVEGMSEIQDYLNNLNETLSPKTEKEILNAGSKVLLEEQKRVAPVAKKNSKNSRSKLSIRTIKNGSDFKAQIGINKSNWKYTRGLWFHYYGFKSHPADNWMDRAFDMSKDDAYDAIVQKFRSLIDKGVL